MSSCYYDIESDLYPAGLVCDSLAISYIADVRPILVNKCLNCHNANSNSGSVTIETYAQVKAQVDNGQLGCTINHEPGCSAMPQNAGQLPPCELKAINVWISEGALEN
jgi:hypothetical protein